jgi:hypothetical protein
MINDDELRERFRALARGETNGAPPFYSEEISVRRSLERRRRERKQQHPLLTSKRLATATGSIFAIAVVLAFGLAWGTNTGYASGLVVSQHARNQLATNAIDISGQLSNLRTELSQMRNAMAGANTGATTQTLLISSTSRLQHIEEVLHDIESELSVTGKLDTASAVSNAFPMKRALTATCNALALDR